MKQTFIAMIRDADGNAITFERFACKKIETVKKNMNTLFTSDLYRACIGQAKTIDIYATPDGRTREQAPAATIEIKNRNK